MDSENQSEVAHPIDTVLFRSGEVPIATTSPSAGKFPVAPITFNIYRSSVTADVARRIRAEAGLLP